MWPEQTISPVGARSHVWLQKMFIVSLINLPPLVPQQLTVKHRLCSGTVYYLSNLPCRWLWARRSRRCCCCRGLDVFYTILWGLRPPGREGETHGYCRTVNCAELCVCEAWDQCVCVFLSKHLVVTSSCVCVCTAVCPELKNFTAWNNSNNCSFSFLIYLKMCWVRKVMKYLNLAF